ncbi:MAG: hypothetical protein JO184_06900 [Gammaproteobacteria bacterium]|nr:hypothetical protein [Gammaproteobacteria bacterium]
MKHGLHKRTVRRRLAWLLLPALLLRAFIPAGFMPAHDSAFPIGICPDGFPAQLLHHGAHHHDHGHGGASQSEHCVFGGSSSAATPQSAAWGEQAPPPMLAESRPATPVLFVRLVHLPEPRGPPTA